MRLSFELSRSERRSELPQQSISTLIKWLVSGAWGKQTASGENVDQDTAMTFSAVWACVRILSETIASLPLRVYQTDGNGNKTEKPDHDVAKLLYQTPNPYLTSFTFRETMMATVALHGNAYAFIIRNRAGKPVSLQILHPDAVMPRKINDGIAYDVKQQDQDDKVIDGKDMIHIVGLSFDGIKGKSPLDVAADNIGLGMALQRFGSEFFKNGASMSGIAKHPGKLSDSAYKRLLESLNEKHTGKGNRHKVQIFEEGMDYMPVTMPLETAQFLQSRKFQISEIARIFRVPPHMLAELDRATFSNIEHQSIEFVQHTIVPWCIRFEQEYNRKLFLPSEQGRFYTKHNLNGLLRGDAKSRAEYYRLMNLMGVLTINDILDLEDKNRIGPEGDVRFVPVNYTTIDKIINGDGTANSNTE